MKAWFYDMTSLNADCVSFYYQANLQSHPIYCTVPGMYPVSSTGKYMVIQIV